MQQYLGIFLDTVKQNLWEILSSMHLTYAGKILIIIWEVFILCSPRQCMATTPPERR